MIAPPTFLVDLFQPWNDYYSHSKAAETIVQFLHVGGLLFAGGLAIAADRGSLRAMQIEAGRRTGHLEELAAVHRWVITGLAVVLTSGLLLLTSDIEAFFGSWVYWVKMALVVLLLANGWGMTRVEQQLRADPSEASPAWGRLHRVAIVSLVLWFTITLAGITLVNVA
jgi:uncharacterized membrane protein